MNRLSSRVLWFLLAIAFFAAAVVFACDGNLDTWARLCLFITQALASAVTFAHGVQAVPVTQAVNGGAHKP